MAPATTAELRQQGKQSRPLKLLSQGKGQERFFFWVCFYFFFPLVFLYLGPGPGLSERIWSKRAQPWFMSDFSF